MPECRQGRLRNGRNVRQWVFALVLVVSTLDSARVLAQTISAADAGAHIGEDVIVEGDVPTVVCSPLACLLSFTVDYSGLVASIPGDVLAAFPPPKETYTSHRVRVRGRVVDKNGRPRIEVRDPGSLQVVDGGSTARVARAAPPADAAPPAGDADAPVAERAAPDPSQAASSVVSRSKVVDPGRVMARAGGPREAKPPAIGDGLIASLGGGGGAAATVEARALQQQIAKLEEANAALSETVAALEERITVLEQSRGAPFAGVNEVELPDLPDYVVSGDSATRLQHIKKGWTTERVMRALGAPLNTTTQANGYMIWYYPNGRAVTFDTRGRVSAGIGF